MSDAAPTGRFGLPGERNGSLTARVLGGGGSRGAVGVGLYRAVFELGIPIEQFDRCNKWSSDCRRIGSRGTRGIEVGVHFEAIGCCERNLLPRMQRQRQRDRHNQEKADGANFYTRYLIPLA